MKELIEALEKIAKIPCQCNCGPMHFEDCTQTIAKKALEAAQQSVKPTPPSVGGSARDRQAQYNESLKKSSGLRKPLGANMRKCPKCKSKEIRIIEVWTGFIISWEPGESIDKGNKEIGNPFKVKGQCLNCCHEWTMRGLSQVSEDMFAPNTART